MIGGDGGHRETVSVMGAIAVSPARARRGFDFATAVDGSITAEKVVELLRDRPKPCGGRW